MTSEGERYYAIPSHRPRPHKEVDWENEYKSLLLFVVFYGTILLVNYLAAPPYCNI